MREKERPDRACWLPTSLQAFRSCFSPELLSTVCNKHNIDEEFLFRVRLNFQAWSTPGGGGCLPEQALQDANLQTPCGAHGQEFLAEGAGRHKSLFVGKVLPKTKQERPPSPGGVSMPG